jgi:NAD(P)-dependent dehydrogenase (short-subunit alcohol dehydrogenase family)
MSHLVIVGGSSGIGLNIAHPLHRLGHTTTCLPREHASLEDCIFIGNVDALLLTQRFRGAGDDWPSEMDVSLTRTKAMIESAATYPYCVPSIVVMASVAAVFVEEEQPVSYHACKAALVEMVKYYAVTLGPKQIRVNAIIPGLTIKPEARAFYDAHPELEATYRDITPLGRMGTLEDLAHLVDFLISDRSSYLTGQTITLDGGIGLRSAWALARRVSPTLRDIPVTQRKATK